MIAEPPRLVHCTSRGQVARAFWVVVVEDASLGQKNFSSLLNSVPASL